MIYRVTFGYSGAGSGWSETFAMLNASNNPADLVPTLRDIAQKRVAMLGREFQIVAIRISRYATDAGARTRGVKLVKETFKNPITTQTMAAEPKDVAYLVRGSATPSSSNPAFDANQNTIFLGGPVDRCVDNAGEVFPGEAGLGAAFAAWRAAMLDASTGWLANETILNVGITSIAQEANGTVKYTFGVGELGTLVVGQKYKARVRAVNSGRSPLNIEQIVRVASSTTLITERVIGIPTPQSGGSVRVYKQVQPFIDYGDLTLAEQVGKHQRGRPYGSSRGRAPDRILG